MKAFRPKTAAYGTVYSWNPETELKDQQDFIVGDTGTLYSKQYSKSSVSLISREKDFFMNIQKWQHKNKYILAWCPGSGAKFLQIEPLPQAYPFSVLSELSWAAFISFLCLACNRCTMRNRVWLIKAFPRGFGLWAVLRIVPDP